MNNVRAMKNIPVWLGSLVSTPHHHHHKKKKGSLLSASEFREEGVVTGGVVKKIEGVAVAKSRNRKGKAHFYCTIKLNHL